MGSASWQQPPSVDGAGLYPDRHGATDRRRRISPDLPTLAQELRQAGLETVAFTDGGYLDRRFGFAAGFDRYDDWVLDAGRWTALGLPRGGARDPQPGSARGIAFRPEGAVRSEPSTFGSALGYVE